MTDIPFDRPIHFEPAYACRADPRFSAYMAVPAVLRTDEPHPLVVVVHGTERGAERLRDAFREFADTEQAVVLCPLFPAGLVQPDDLDDYKVLAQGGTRFDEVLLHLIDDASLRVPIRTDTFALFGFSGGGQFAHRFWYRHPERLFAVSLGAPGRITALTDRPWPEGIDGAEDWLGRGIDPSALADVPVQLVIGARDVHPLPPDTGNFRSGITGPNRLVRMRHYRDDLISRGFSPRFDVVPGVAHDGLGILGPVRDFLRANLALARG